MVRWYQAIWRGLSYRSTDDARTTAFLRKLVARRRIGEGRQSTRNQTSPCDQPERLEGRLIQSRRSLTRISLAATPSTPRAERLDTAKRLSDPRRTQDERTMPGNPREMITTAERRFSVRIRIAVPPSGLGQRHPQITAWLDENRRADGWAMTPSGTRGVLNDALSI